MWYRRRVRPFRATRLLLSTLLLSLAGCDFLSNYEPDVPDNLIVVVELGRDELFEGEVTKVSVKVVDATGREYNYLAPHFLSRNPEVATVSATGDVSALSAGETAILAILDQDGYPRAEGAARLVVKDVTGTIAGRVTMSGVTPIAGQTVTLEGRTTITDFDGRYSFNGLEAGDHFVSLGNLPPGLLCIPPVQLTVVRARETTTVNFDCTQADFTIVVTVTFVHVGNGVSFACARATVSETAFSSTGSIPLEALTGATWSVAWTGPGVVGGTQRTGGLDANNQLLDRQQINRFGTYTATLSVTANGVTKQASGSVTVGSAQGTCTPP